MTDFFFRSTDSSVHWTLGDVISSTLDAAIAADRAEAADERERLLYVACTRALDLLVLPEASWAPDGGWAKFFDLGQSALEEIKYPPPQRPEPTQFLAVIEQPDSIFADESERILRMSARIEWRRPSSADIDRGLLDSATIDVGTSEGDATIRTYVLGAGALRGTILHKLMEELLTKMLDPDLAQLTDRAYALTQEAIVTGGTAPDPSEVAATALRTFSHETLKTYIPILIPEVPLFGARSDMVLVSARADAIAFEGGVPVAAFDWKSDVAPTPDDHEAHASQLLEYLELIGVEKGALVYMTSGDVRWVHRNPNKTPLA